MEAGEICYEKVGRVGTLTIDRPHARNGMNKEVALTAYEILKGCYEDPDLNLLILRGAGRDFCAGAEIVNGGEVEAACFEPLDPRPFDVAVLLRVADTSARFNTAFLDVGVAGDLGGPWLLPRLIGASRARHLYFFPRKFDGAEAHAMGLVDDLVEPDAFEDRLVEMGRYLNSVSPLALRGMKRNFIYAESTDFPTYIAIETERHGQLLQSADHAEGFRAFAEKRTPVFQGR
jgi:2-(1,2-epoxy-1,2-dihydrophenyl)acetyl-CoA isomerase